MAHKHTWAAVLIQCMDGRTHPTIHQILKSLRIRWEDRVDLISLAGGAGVEVSSNARKKKEWEKQLALSLKLHNPSNVILVGHEPPCGGGGKKINFRRALRKIRNLYSGKRVLAFWLIPQKGNDVRWNWKRVD